MWPSENQSYRLTKYQAGNLFDCPVIVSKRRLPVVSDVGSTAGPWPGARLAGGPPPASGGRARRLIGYALARVGSRGENVRSLRLGYSMVGTPGRELLAEIVSQSP